MSTVRKVPMRKCVGCGEMKNKKELIRVLKTPEEEILLDATGRKNGRGAYLCRDQAVSYTHLDVYKRQQYCCK